MHRIVVAVFLCASALFAQDTLTNENIVSLWKSQVPVSIIVQHIASYPGVYQSSATTIHDLTAAGVPETIISAAVLRQAKDDAAGSPARTRLSDEVAKPSNPPSAGTDDGATQQATQQATQPATQSATQASNRPARSSRKAAQRSDLTQSTSTAVCQGQGDWPATYEKGVYYRPEGTPCWTAMKPEDIFWSHSSLAKNLKAGATLGMLKRPDTGTISRRYSRNPFPTDKPLEVVVILRDFMVINLQQGKGSRGVTRPLDHETDFHVIATNSDKGMSKIEWVGAFGTGEYGIIDVAEYERAKTVSQKIYTFHNFD